MLFVRFEALLAAGLIWVAAPAAAETPADVVISPDGAMGLIDWGLYEGHDVGSDPAGDTVEGRVHRSDGIVLLRQVMDICAREGTTFGIRYSLSEKPNALPLVLDVTTDHPMLVAPSGRSGTRDVYKKVMRYGSASYNGWTVSFPYEHVPGDYTFSIVANGVVMLRKTFHISFDCNTPVS